MPEVPELPEVPESPVVLVEPMPPPTNDASAYDDVESVPLSDGEAAEDA